MSVRPQPGRRRLRRSIIIVLLIAWTLVTAAPIKAGEDAQGTDGGSEQITTILPRTEGGGHFTENLGQWDGQVDFVAGCSFGAALFTSDGVVYDVAYQEGGHRVKMAFEGATPAEPVGVGDMGFPTNYLLGSDREAWVTGARSYRELVYEDVWPGVDLRYHFCEGALKYDLIVEAGADLAPVRFRVEGSEGIDIAGGGLDVSLSGTGSIRDTHLAAWYSDGEPVDVRFDVDGDTYGFEVDGDPRRSMVIDPVVMHSSTYLGGSYAERAIDVVVDGEDNIVLVGECGSSDYPVTTGAYETESKGEDVVVTKMNHNCSRILWSTFIGGRRYDQVNALAVDERNHIYLTGNTWSGDWPTTQGAYCEDINLGWGEYNIDIYVTKMSPMGDSVECSTFIGGTMAELPYDIDVRGGRVAVGGYTISPDFPTTKGSHSANMGAAVIMTFNANLSRMEGCWVWDGVASENVRAVAIDKNGDVTVTGWAGSPGFPTTPGAYKHAVGWPTCSFVARYSPTQDIIIFCTMLGDGYYDFVETMTVDDDLNVYLAGRTELMGDVSHPVTEGAFDQLHTGRYEGWVTKMDPNGTRLIASTLLGGDGTEAILGIDLDRDGNVVVVGSTDSAVNFTLTPDCHDDTVAGAKEGFITILNEDFTEVIYSSFHGGTYEDELYAVSVDNTNNYVVVGATDSNDLPVLDDGFQTRYAGIDDMLVAVIGEHAPTSAPLSLMATGREGHIDLGWRPPSDIGRYPLREYHLYRGTSEALLRPYKVLDDVPSYIDGDVEWGVTYYYAVYASNWKGMSPPSNVVSAKSVTVPDPPTNLTAEVGIDSVTLEWLSPSFTGGIPLLEFRVYRTAEGGQRVLVTTLGPDAVTFVDSEAEDGTLYTYSVSTANEYGESRKDVNVTVLTRGVPTPPREVEHSYGDLFIRISWRPPLKDFGLPVTEYRVHRQGIGGPAEVIGVLEATGTGFTDTNVQVGEGYKYHVTAVNAKGESPPSELIDAKVMVPPGSPTDVQAVAHVQYVRITWAPPLFDGASPVLGYRVYLVGGSDEAISIGGKNVEDIADVQLVFLHDVPYDGIVRSYFVTAFNAEGEGEPSEIALTFVYEVPAAPRGLSVEWGDGVLSLEWQTPETDGGAEVTAFTVYRQAAGEDGPTKMLVVPSSTLTFIDVNVENGVEYTYTVTCTNIVGEGPRSSPMTGVPAGLPSPPLTVTAEGMDGSVRISWQTPGWDGGRDIEGYLVFIVTDGTSLQEIAQVGSDAREHVHDGLENGKVYVYVLKAFTIVGASEISGLAEARPVGPPSPPKDLDAFWMEGHVLLTWDVPEDDGGSPLLGYMLLREDWDEAKWTQVLDPTFSDLDVEQGMTYNYTIYAYNAAGDSPIAKVSFTVPQEEEDPVEPEVFEWTYLVLVVVLLALSMAFLYNGLRMRSKAGDGRRS